MSESLVQLDNIRFAYRLDPILDDFDWQWPPHKHIAVLGGNGCGKTTLLNIIAGLDKDVVGSVTLGNDQSLKNIRISYMFQNPRLLPWLSVLENVQIVLDDTPDNAAEAEKLLDQMDLTESLHEFPNRLSGGMQRRVALARAFVTKPQLLLLDEPFVSLDLPVGNLLRQLLLNLWQGSPTTVIFVTHDLRESIFLADRIAFLSRSPSELILDQPVPMSRPRNIEDPSIDAFRNDLLSTHPSLLHGKIQRNAMSPGKNEKPSSSINTD